MEKSRLNTCPIDDKYWEVLEEYSYETSKGLVVVPKGFRTDYASVPKIFRNIINTYGKHGREAFINDWLYSSKCKINITRGESDNFFYLTIFPFLYKTFFTTFPFSSYSIASPFKTLSLKL